MEVYGQFHIPAALSSENEPPVSSVQEAMDTVENRKIILLLGI
jgi:hypothetical protein